MWRKYRKNSLQYKKHYVYNVPIKHGNQCVCVYAGVFQHLLVRANMSFFSHFVSPHHLSLALFFPLFFFLFSPRRIHAVEPDLLVYSTCQGLCYMRTVSVSLMQLLDGVEVNSNDFNMCLIRWSAYCELELLCSFQTWISFSELRTLAVKQKLSVDTSFHHSVSHDGWKNELNCSVFWRI